MAELNNLKNVESVSGKSNVALAVAIVIILALMLLPIPTFFMDILLVMNITGALVILFISLYVINPTDFSVFPSLLLIVTLFRLSLNVSTTRLILGRGYAGEIIESFGNFVVGGNYVVGIVIFAILVIINFVVITKGAGRIAEVSARFTLDAMPGKQMAIDADLNAGMIDDFEAKSRRTTIAQEAEFYGAMDGASKFVRGDAIAGLLITAINILGGLLIGVFQRGMPVGEAANHYTLLTIGDGLVAQIPALIISTSAGIIITRAAGEKSMGAEITKQISNQPKAAMVSAAVLFSMGIVPGLPFIPFTIMAVVVGLTAQIMKKAQDKEFEEIKQLEESESEEEQQPEERLEDFLHPDPFEVEIGYGLIPLVDSNQGGNLLKRISTIRKSIVLEMGLIVPPIRIRDNIQLKPNEYVFKIYGIEVSKWNVLLNNYLVLNPDDRIELSGLDTIEPTFGLTARWISKNQKEKAEVAQYTVIEPPAVIATHLMEVLKANSYKLLDRQKTQAMLDHIKEDHPAVVEGLVPDMVSLGVVNQILRNLLKEKIPIRNFIKILETIADYANITKDPDMLTEYVRASLSETITDCLKQDDEQLTVATLDPRVEEQIMQMIKNGQMNSQNMGFSPNQVNNFFESMASRISEMTQEGTRPILLVSPPIRRVVRSFIEPIFPDLSVISFSELTSDTNIKSIGAIEYPNEA